MEGSRQNQEEEGRVAEAQRLMAEREQPKALVLLRIVADGLRDPIRHVKYPDEELCARCGGKWPCPNGAFDELREEIKRLADLQRQLWQAQDERDAAERERDRFRELGDRVMEKRAEAIKRGAEAVHIFYWMHQGRERWRMRAEAAEGLLEEVGRLREAVWAVQEWWYVSRDEIWNERKRGIEFILGRVKQCIFCKKSLGPQENKDSQGYGRWGCWPPCEPRAEALAQRGEGDA